MTLKPTPILFSFLLGTIAACATPNPNPELQGRGSMWAGEAIRNASLNNALIAQHTLYPYHFVSGSTELNDLGRRDLNVLAAHFVENAGGLNVRRGEAGTSLYEARVKAVLEHLSDCGVPSGSVSVKDGPAGGEGMSSERVITVLKGKMSKDDNSFSGTSSSTSSGAGAGLIQ